MKTLEMRNTCKLEGSIHHDDSLTEEISISSAQAVEMDNKEKLVT